MGRVERPRHSSPDQHREDLELAGTQEDDRILRRCTLCHTGCQLALAPAGPDRWQAEYPRTDGAGLCARGSALAELSGNPRRILSAARRDGPQLRALELDAALREILDAAAGKTITLLLDGNVPCEQMAAAAAWASAWPDARLCPAVEPGDRELLLGIEASGTDYLGIEDLEACDGFLIIGDAFAANPRCSRGVLDRARAEPKTPIVAIDPGSGSASKFASHRIPAAPGGELAALAALASAAGVQSGIAGPVSADDVPLAAAGDLVAALARAAGAALSALLFAREPGRSGCGELTAHATWQAASQPLPRLRVSPQDAGAMHLKNMSLVTVHNNGASVRAQVRVAPELAPGTLVLPEGCARTRSLAPAGVEPGQDAVITELQSVQVST